MPLDLMMGLMAGAVLSGVIPLVNAELLVVGVAAAVPAAAIPLVAIVCGSGQMLSKSMLYGLARWAPSRLPHGARARLERASQGLTRRGGAAGSVVFTSASVGLPPFYGVSIAAGALRVRFATFVTLGLIGRILRFGVLAWGANQAGRTLLENLMASLGLGFGN